MCQGYCFDIKKVEKLLSLTGELSVDKKPRSLKYIALNSLLASDLEEI